MNQVSTFVKGVGICLAFAVMLLCTASPGHAYDEKKVNKILKSIQKKHAATVKAAYALKDAMRAYEAGGGAVDETEKRFNQSHMFSNPKKQKAYRKKALKIYSTSHKKIRKLHAAWEKRSKALWKELKKLNQELQ